MLKIAMQVMALRALRDFWRDHPRAEMPLRPWYGLVSNADWSTPADVRHLFGSADFVGDNRVIFDVGGNKYRIVAHIAYKYHRVLIKLVGTHGDYDHIDPEKV